MGNGSRRGIPYVECTAVEVHWLDGLDFNVFFHEGPCLLPGSALGILANSRSPFQIKEVIALKKKLYVGNLSFETTENDLKELFGQTGSVETVRIITDRDTGRSKGFGFVEMQDGGDKAIAEMNGKDFKGRALTVNEARPMSPRDSRGDGFKRY